MYVIHNVGEKRKLYFKEKKKKKSEYCSQIGLKFNWDVLQYKVK